MPDQGFVGRTLFMVDSRPVTLDINSSDTELLSKSVRLAETKTARIGISFRASTH